MMLMLSLLLIMYLLSQFVVILYRLKLGSSMLELYGMLAGIVGIVGL